MKIVTNEFMVFFDVDETLVMHSLDNKDVHVVDPYDQTDLYLTEHKKHVKLLKDHKARGYYVVVWSANGWRWAKEIVTQLALESYVDEIMTKPIKVVDDLQPNEFLNRIYFKDE